MANALEKIYKGMKVYDQQNKEIGTVEYVQFGDEDSSTSETETSTISPVLNDTDNSLVGNILDVFRTDDVPEALRSRLMRSGFVRIDASGLFNADRYISPDQIQSVVGEHVVLNVSEDDLIQRT